MSYPIKTRSISLDHRGGTKSYHLMIIEAANGNAVFISRWGKTGQFGEMKVEEYDSPAKAMKAWEKKEREKTRNGYGQAGPAREGRADTSDEFPKAVSLSIFNKMGASAVKHLDPGFDTAGMREADPAQYDEETGRKIDTARKADISEALAAEKAASEKAAAEAYADNPIFGRF
jgi:predicted DNA-binding WGR domain protein